MIIEPVSVKPNSRHTRPVRSLGGGKRTQARDYPTGAAILGALPRRWAILQEALVCVLVVCALLAAEAMMSRVVRDLLRSKQI